MKRVVSIFLLAVICLVGCAPVIEDSSEGAEITDKERYETEGAYLDASGNEIDLKKISEGAEWAKVRLTYPVDFVTEDELALYKEAYESVEVDENNRVTVIMSKSQYETLKTDTETAILADFEACTGGELAQILPNIVNVTTDENYSDIRVFVNGDINKDQVTPFAYLLCRDVYRNKALVGNNEETVVTVIDSETGAVYGELNYKDADKALSNHGGENNGTQPQNS